MKTSALVTVIILAAVWPQAPRLTPPAPAAATASVSGTVVNDAGSPVRLAIVTMASDGGGGASAVSDEQGRFRIGGLAAGRYTLSAAKVAHVMNAYGAKRPGRRGTPLQLTSGQQITGLSLLLPRGAVITGTVRELKGQPVSGVDVAALPAAMTSASSSILVTPDASVTDDRGVYRVFGLPPGEYVVIASPRVTGAGPMAAPTTDRIDAALRDLTQGASLRTAKPQEEPQVGIAVSYYPGTAEPARAQRLTVGPGDERSGVDVVLQRVRTGSVAGTVLMRDGSPLPPGLRLSISSEGPRVGSGTGVNPFGGSIAADGSFRFSALQPGTHTIVAAMLPGRGGNAPPVWGRATVTVDGNDVAGVVVHVGPALEATGRIQVDSSARATAMPMKGVRITATPINFIPPLTSTGSFLFLGTNNPMRSAEVDDAGNFTIAGLTPGRYYFGVGITQPSADWQLGSAMLDGRDIADVGLDVGDTDVNGIVVTLIDTHTELSGTLTSGSGQPATDYFVVAFPADRSLWVQGRRMQSTRPGSDGRFLFRDLPAGDYLMSALTDLDPSDLGDTSFVEQLAAQAIKVTIRAAGRTVQDIRIR